MSTIKSNHLNKTWLAITAASALALTGCATDSGKSSVGKQQSDSGSTLKIGLLTSNDRIRPQLDAFMAEHKAHFRVKWIEGAAVVAAIAAILAMLWYAWEAVA